MSSWNKSFEWQTAGNWSLKILAYVPSDDLHVIMNSCLPFKHSSALSTYKVIGLLVDKTFFIKGVFFI